MSCASWMSRTLLFTVASGTKLLGVSSNHDLYSINTMASVFHWVDNTVSIPWNLSFSEATTQYLVSCWNCNRVSIQCPLSLSEEARQYQYHVTCLLLSYRISIITMPHVSWWGSNTVATPWPLLADPFLLLSYQYSIHTITSVCRRGIWWIILLLR